MYSDHDGGKKYRAKVNECVKHVIKPTQADTQSDTVIYPLVQMGPFDVRVDEFVTSKLFKSPSPDVTIYLASGYLNLVEKYTHSIIHQCSAMFRILTAAPEVNHIKYSLV